MRPINVVIVASLIWLSVSFWNRNDLPTNIDYVSDITNEPRQKLAKKRPFTADYNDVEYLVEPEFEYELYGLIVSYRHHNGESRMHRSSNDHLNMLDVCVVWGDNTYNRRLHKIDFWNGVWTCNVQTKDQQAWNAFDVYQLSNNHLISDNELIREQVRSIQVGDQIHVKGYLASYGTDKNRMRGTSTTRLDTGNGACETIFVEQFGIVQAATNLWRRSMYLSLGVFVLALVVFIKRPYRPYR